MPKEKVQKSKVPANRLPHKKAQHPNIPPPPKEFQFKKGQSGNPSGRPKLLGESYKQWLRRTEAGETVANADRVAESLGSLAIAGDVPAAREIRSATEGDVIRLFAGMTDAELDTYIAERERELDAVSAPAEIVDSISVATAPAISNPPDVLARVGVSIPPAYQRAIERLLAEGDKRNAQRMLLDFLAKEFPAPLLP